MYKLILLLAVALTAAHAQQTNTCLTEDGHLCIMYEDEIYAYLNFSRIPCSSSYYSYQLIKPLENGDQYVMASGQFYGYYDYSYQFGAGNGFVIYFGLYGMTSLHSNSGFTVDYAAVTVPSLSSEAMKSGPFTYREPDHCSTEAQRNFPCRASTTTQYEFGEDYGAFYNLQEYNPAVGPQLKPYISYQGCIYLIDQTDMSPPRHLAPVVCYNPYLEPCAAGTPLTVESRSGLYFHMAIDYTLGSSSTVLLPVVDDLVLEVAFSSTWLQTPTLQHSIYTVGYTVTANLRNAEGIVASAAQSQDNNFAICGAYYTSHCSGNANADTSFFFTSFDSSFSSGWTSFTSFDSSFSTFFSSSSDWSTDRSSNSSHDEEDDGTILLWLLGGVLMVLTVLVVAVIVFVLVFAKKQQYRPIVALSEEPTYTK